MSFLEASKAPAHFLRAVPFILADKKLVLFCLVPYLLGLSTFVISVIMLFSHETDLMSWLVGDATGWKFYLLWIVFTLGILLAAGISGIIALSLAGAWFIESLIEHSLRKLEFSPTRVSGVEGFLKSTGRGLRDDVIRLFYISVIVLLSLLCSFFPPLMLIPLILGAFLVGFDLIDLPLTLLGYHFKERWHMIWKHKLRVATLGACYSLVMLIPLVGMLLLPVAYQAAIFSLESWELLEHSPKKNGRK